MRILKKIIKKIIVKKSHHPDKQGIPVNKMLRSSAENPITASSSGVGDNLHFGRSWATLRQIFRINLFWGCKKKWKN